MDIFSLTDGKYIDNLKSVDNGLIRQLYGLAVNSAKNKKMVSVVFSNVLSKKSSMTNLSSIDSSILNVCQLTPLQDKENCKTLMEEIAKYRWERLNFQYDENYWKEKVNLLFLDYLLSSCLCYIEVFNSDTNGRSGNVEKFYATRNRFIAGRVAGLSDNETTKYVNYLSPILADYRIGSLRVLKLSHQKKGFKIVQPKSAINFNRAIKVTPLFLIDAFIRGFMPTLKENIVRFKYIKDNGQEREIYTTLSNDIFKKYYGSDYAVDIVSKCELKMDRGYIKIPELGCSRYDETGLRALNLSRIISIEIVDSFDSSYIDVDFSKILPFFKATIEAINDLGVLQIVYQTLLGELADDKGIAEMRSNLVSYVDSRYTIGTTTFQKELHNYMKKYPNVFKGYTGKPMEVSLNVEKSVSFNLGFEED